MLTKAKEYNKKAFTLIELLVVIVIIGVLATLAVIMLNNARTKAKDAHRVSDIKQLRTALDLYHANESSYPDSITIGEALVGPTSGETFMNEVPQDPDAGSTYGDECVGGYTYAKDGNGYKIYYCLANRTGDVPAGNCVATQDIMCDPAGSIQFGLGQDGSHTVSSTADLTSDVSGDLDSDGCADAKVFTVNSLGSDSATLSASADSCLAVNDKVLLIALQEGAYDTAAQTYDVVGNYETLTVGSVSGTEVSFVGSISNDYGDPSSDKVVLQRVPQYNNLTVNGTLTAGAWSGSSGGVLAFKVMGTLSGAGTITMSGKGYRGGDYGSASMNDKHAAKQGEGLAGQGVSNECAENDNVGGGGGGHATGDWAPDGGAGGGYSAAGTNGGASDDSAGAWGCICTISDHGSISTCTAVPGDGGRSYGVANLSRLYFGGGGGAGGADDHASGGGDYGGDGGGIIYIEASTVSGTLTITSEGGDAVNIQGGGGGGSGAGGSILLKACEASFSLADAGYGTPTTAGDTVHGGDGGNGANGRIAIFLPSGISHSGVVSPTPHSGTLSGCD